MFIYSIYDKVSDKYAPIFEAENDKVAARIVYGQISKVPDYVRKDLELYCLSPYDSQNGIVWPMMKEIKDIVADGFPGKFVKHVVDVNPEDFE